MEYKTRKQLAEELADLEYINKDLGEDIEYIVVSSAFNDDMILTINERFFGHVDTSFGGFTRGLKDNQKRELMEIVIPYVLTPLDKRKGTKLYTAHSRLLGEYGHDALNLELINGIYFIDTPDSKSDKFKTKFTLEELENIGILGDKFWRILEV